MASDIQDLIESQHTREVRRGPGVFGDRRFEAARRAVLLKQIVRGRVAAIPTSTGSKGSTL
jgi:hypothetical protein